MSRQRAVTSATVSAVLGPYELPTPELLQERLGVSQAAAELYLSSEVLDLHLETYSFYRAVGYHPYRRHSGGLQRALVLGQADIPRLLEAGVNGATWVITGHPLRPADTREDAFRRLYGELVELLSGADGKVEVVHTASEYRRARSRGAHAAFVGVQGAHAFPPDPSVLTRLPGPLLRITLLHLTDTAFGSTSAPSMQGGNRGLGAVGHAFIEQMNASRIGVDLSHISERGFWDALQTSDPSLPVLVTHTGVDGGHRHWRNLTDAQLRAIAERGGTVGIMYHSKYLGDPLFGGRVASVVRHIRHTEKVIGADHISLGSDWDGAICTPRDMPTCLELPRLVDALLLDGMKDAAIEKLLGQNALRVIGELKGDA